MASTVMSTTLNFGMVSAPVSLKKVADKKEVAFSLASPAGNGVKQVYVDQETGEVVGTSAECVKGIFDDPKNKVGFHEVPREAIAAIDETVKLDSLTIDGFMPLDEVPFERAEGAYFVAPQGKSGTAAAKPLALLRDGLAKTGRAGIGKLTLRTKQRPFVVYADNGGLIVNVLAFAEDVEALAEAGEVLNGVATDEKTLGLAVMLIEAQAVGRADLDALADSARPLREDLVAQAVAGAKIEAPEKPEAEAPTFDLEAALAASVAQAAPKKQAAKVKVAA